MSVNGEDSTNKKVRDRDVVDAFKKRPDMPANDSADIAGKWELSSQEVAEAVNDRLELDDGISRQAIHRRLENLDEVVKVKHGRTVTWRLKSDSIDFIGKEGRPQKFTDEQLLECFNETHRRRVGKIELSSKEITNILNNQVLNAESKVTRQAVHNRLEKLKGDKLQRNKHGRLHTYIRLDDIDNLWGDGREN